MSFVHRYSASIKLFFEKFSGIGELNVLQDCSHNTSALFYLKGSTIWTMDPTHVSLETMAAPAVVLPDLDGDNTSDLLVLTVGESQVRNI